MEDLTRSSSELVQSLLSDAQYFKGLLLLRLVIKIAKFVQINPQGGARNRI
jgi:hypothetical protein